jgi:HEAT repeat protein
MSAETGHPVMVSMAMDGERANDWLASHHFKDPEVVRVAELLPCLVASVFGEGGIQAENVEHGEADGICVRYGSIPCAAHQQVEAYARRELMDDAVSFPVPRHIFVTADGQILEHRAYYLSERDLRWLMLRALREADSNAAVWLAIRRLQPLWRSLCAEADTPERRAAMTMLAHLVNSGDEYAIALLQDFALAEMSAVVRLELLEMLILEAIPDPVHALRGFLHDSEREVRQRAWQIMKKVTGRIDLSAAVPYLSQEEQDESVMAAALRTLRIEDRSNAVLVVDADQGSRWTLIDMLLATLDAASIKGLDLVVDGPSSEGRNRILRTLASLAEDESSSRRVFGQASSPEDGAVAAIRALAKAPGGLDERSRDLLMQQAKSPNALVRQEAVTQLGRHRVREASAVLKAALEDPAGPVRIAAAIGLWRQSDRSVARHLVGALDDPEFGAEARTLLEAAYVESTPKTPDDWRRWLGVPEAPR